MDFGDRYLTGRSAKRSAARALVFFDTICTVDPDSCARIADLLWKRKRYVDALAYFERGCDGGDDEACVDAGVVLASGRRVKKDLKRAWRLFDRACSEEPSRCQKLAKKYRRPGEAKSRRQSVARAVRKQKDDPEAQKIAGLARSCRVSLAGEKPSAVDGAACLELAGIYASTKSNRRDPVKAALYYNEACGLAEPRACLRLGDMYRDGRGIEQSGNDAASLYRQACLADEPFGCWRLGRLYRDGTIVDKDFDKAREWLQRACDTGAQSACSDLERLPRNRKRR